MIEFTSEARRTRGEGKGTEHCFGSNSCSVMSNSLWPHEPTRVAHLAPLSTGFSRQVYWSGLQFSPQGDLPDPGIETASLVFPVLAEGFFATVSPGKPTIQLYSLICYCLSTLKKKSYLLQNSHESHLLLYFLSLSLFNYLPLSMAIPSVQSLIYIISGHFFSSFSLRITGSSFLHTHPFTGSGSLFPVYLYSPEFYSHTLVSQKLKFLLCES